MLVIQSQKATEDSQNKENTKPLMGLLYYKQRISMGLTVSREMPK